MPYNMPMCELYMHILLLLCVFEHCMKLYCSMFNHVFFFFFYGMQLKSGLDEQEETRQDWQPKLAENWSFWACSLWAVGCFLKMNSKPELFWILEKKGWSLCQNSGSLFGSLCNVLLFSCKGSRPFKTTKIVKFVDAYGDKKVHTILSKCDKKRTQIW